MIVNDSCSMHFDHQSLIIQYCYSKGEINGYKFTTPILIYVERREVHLDKLMLCQAVSPKRGEVTGVQTPQNCIEKHKKFQCPETVATSVLDALINTSCLP